MEKAKRILFTISGVFSIIGIVLWAVLGIVFVVLGSNPEFIDKAIEGGATSDEAEAMKLMFMCCGVMFIIFGLMSIVNTILCFKGKNSDSKNIMILNIVFGAISGIEINILAAIFGLIARNQKPKAVE